jgi:hypothetical protein
LFVAGIIVGLAVTAVARTQTPNRGIVGLNHIALGVPNLDEAVKYYTRRWDFQTFHGVDGASPSRYVQISHYVCGAAAT